MKKILFSFLMIHSFLSLAADIVFLGPCSDKPLIAKEFLIVKDTSVGELTISFLEDQKIAYLGSSVGLNSIFNSPVGDQAIEVVSDSELKAYGWCYSVNGIEPNVFPNEYSVTNSDKVLWWFGFAHFKDGQWISQCTPGYLHPSKSFCE